MLLQIIWNFQMNRNESFYFRTEVRKQKWCVPTSSVPLPKMPLLPAHSDSLLFPAVSISQVLSLSCIQEVASWPLQSCAAAGDALSMELWLLWATCPSLEHASHFLPENLLHLSQPFQACCTHGIQCFLPVI